MTHVHMFCYNIPADNQVNGRTDGYINVIAKWDTDNIFSDGRPMTFANPVNLNFYDCIEVKDWRKAVKDIDCIAQNHFEVLAREERINKARAILAVEILDNPITERLKEIY